MKITFLGTAAATACPLVFCDCPSCRAGWAEGGRNMRLRSSLAVNDDLLFDFGPDVTAEAFRAGFDLRGVRYWLQTHAHSDHFCAGHIVTRHPAYATRGIAPLSVYASEACLAQMEAQIASEERDATWRSLQIDPHAVRPGETFRAGRYTAMALPAEHCEGALLYMLSDGERRLLYALDTRAIPETAWDMLRGTRLDIAILDHTYGSGIHGGGHMNADDVAEAAARLRRAGILAQGAPVYATHISHEGMPPHEALDAFARERGYRAAWDGLTLTV